MAQDSSQVGGRADNFVKELFDVVDRASANNVDSLTVIGALAFAAISTTAAVIAASDDVASGRSTQEYPH